MFINFTEVVVALSSDVFRTIVFRVSLFILLSEGIRYLELRTEKLDGFPSKKENQK